MEEKNVIIADSLDGLGTKFFENHLAHAFCLGGKCTFVFNGKEFELHGGDLMIVRKGKLMERIRTSSDFRIKVIYVDAGFIELCTPQSNYGMKGQLALFLDPVMRLTPAQQAACRADFEAVEERLRNTDHHFYRETVINALRLAILDFFDFHSHLYGETIVSTQNASIMSRFLGMLENGTYRQHREVSYYADCLCVTAKYLSEVSKKVSGFAANYWINHYTILDISRLLRDKSLSFAQISDLFGFSSLAYFSRYVQHNLGGEPLGLQRITGRQRRPGAGDSPAPAGEIGKCSVTSPRNQPIRPCTPTLPNPTARQTPVPSPRISAEPSPPTGRAS